MKHLAVAILFAFSAFISAFNSQASEALRAPAKVVSLGTCQSRTLLIELNVGGHTPKSQLVDAIKLFAAYQNFSFTPVFSLPNEVAFRAELHDSCVSDSCAKELGWFDLQSRLARYKGVTVDCEIPRAAHNAPTAPAAPMPGPAPGPGQPPPPPGKGGVTGGN